MKLKILQWNIWYKENPKKISEEILRFDPDIVCAQELMQNLPNNIDTAKTIKEITKFNSFYKESETWDNRPDKTSQGNAIFSKYPFVSTSFKYVNDPVHNPLNASVEGRVYLESVFKINGRKLIVGTTHLSYSHRFKIDNRRKNEAKILKNILSSNKEDFIFCGDLNAIPSSYTIKEISKVDNLKNFGPNVTEPTWTTKPFDYKGFKEDKLNWRLDYVFGTNNLNVLKSEILKTDYSDHLPVLVEIEI